MHHIVEAGITFSRLEVLVFDEADRMFEMGFADQINAISKEIRAERQTMLLSATLPAMVYEFARAGLNDPKLVRLDKHVTLPPNLQLAFLLTSTEQKIAAFLYLFKFVIRPEQQTIVFCATRHSAQMLQVALTKMLSIDSGVVFGSMEPEMRKLNIERFRMSKMQVLLVTDVAARGTITHPRARVSLLIARRYRHSGARSGGQLRHAADAEDFCASRGPRRPRRRTERPQRPLLRLQHRRHAGSEPHVRCKSGPASLAIQPVRCLTAAFTQVHMFLNKPLCCTMQPDMASSCCYGAIPSVMLDAESNLFKRALRDVELSERHRVAIGASQNYMKTRAMATKEGAALSKTIGHVPIHPTILAMGPEAGGDPLEEQRMELVRDYLGSYRPKQTVFELETASKESKDVMEAKRLVHPERRERKRPAPEREDDREV